MECLVDREAESRTEMMRLPLFPVRVEEGRYITWPGCHGYLHVARAILLQNKTNID